MNCVIHGDVQSWKDASFTEQGQQLEQAGADGRPVMATRVAWISGAGLMPLDPAIARKGPRFQRRRTVDRLSSSSARRVERLTERGGQIFLASGLVDVGQCRQKKDGARRRADRGS